MHSLSAALLRALRDAASRPGQLLLAAMLCLLGNQAGMSMAQAQLAGPAAIRCPNTPSSPTGPDFSNRDLSGMNFNRLDLRNANFSGATLKGTVFIGAKLAGANFSNARVLKSDNEELRPTDFTGADLHFACFADMSFAGRSYFTHADFSCADFSGTRLNSGLTIFGASPLKIDASVCKPAFRGAVMNCEFVADWPKLEFGIGQDGSGSDLSACGAKLAGIRLDGADLSGSNLAGAKLDGAGLKGANLTRANLAGASLDGANMNGATLSGAHLDNASLQCRKDGDCVDLRNAQLQGATLKGANLSGADLSGAVLTKDGLSPAANLSGAHLRNVNLSNAKLTGADFSSANFYSSFPNVCKGSQPGCARANGATLTDTIFSNAYLYGADFSNATIIGTDFSGAILIAANFSGAAIDQNGNGVPARFQRAHLEGSNLGAANIRSADLSNAYFDFRSGGNAAYLNLDGASHNRHACASPSCIPPAGADVCVLLSYGDTLVPENNPGLTCPNPDAPASGACGPARRDGSNPAWKSARPLTDPPLWYFSAATYSPAAAPTAVCNGKGPNAAIVGW
jgi:uncharacterized protein YjbI with pentapeptide repeats